MDLLTSCTSFAYFTLLLLVRYNFLQVFAESNPNVIQPENSNFNKSGDRYLAKFMKQMYYSQGGDSNICMQDEIEGLPKLMLNVSCPSVNESVSAVEIIYTIPSVGIYVCLRCKSESGKQCNNHKIEEVCHPAASNMTCTNNTSIPETQLNRCNGTPSCLVEFLPRIKLNIHQVYWKYCITERDKICWDINIHIKFQCQEWTSITTDVTTPTTSNVNGNSSYVIGIALGGIITLIIITIVVCVICIWKKRRSSLKRKKGDESSSFIAMADAAVARNSDMNNTYLSKQPLKGDFTTGVVFSKEENKQLLKRDSMDYDEIDVSTQNASNSHIENTVEIIQGQKLKSTNQLQVTPSVGLRATINNKVNKSTTRDDEVSLNDQSYQEICLSSTGESVSRHNSNVYDDPPDVKRNGGTRGSMSHDMGASSRPTDSTETKLLKHKSLLSKQNKENSNKLGLFMKSKSLSLDSKNNMEDVRTTTMEKSMSGERSNIDLQDKSNETPDMIDNLFYGTGGPMAQQSEIPKDPNVGNQLDENPEDPTLIENKYYESFEVKNNDGDKDVAEKSGDDMASVDTSDQHASRKLSTGHHNDALPLDVGPDDYSYVYNHFPLEGRKRAPTLKEPVELL